MTLLGVLAVLAVVLPTAAFALGITRAQRILNRLDRTVHRMELATAVVAENLAESVSRADATDGPEGAAADAALRTGDTAAAIHQRQGD